MNIFEKILGERPRFSSMDFNHTYKPEVEDVDFQEVREEPSYDLKVREKQILDAAFEEAKPLLDKKPLMGLSHALLWAEGAQWGDKHPVSSFPSNSERVDAARSEVDRLIEDAHAGKGADPILSSVLLLAFYSGALWAENHPPVCPNR